MATTVALRATRTDKPTASHMSVRVIASPNHFSVSPGERKGVGLLIRGERIQEDHDEKRKMQEQHGADRGQDERRQEPAARLEDGPSQRASKAPILRARDR